MKRNVLIILLLFILSLVVQSLYAETGDNFNSRRNTPISAVKGYLQLNGWFFSDFDVNRNGWAPNMEGDGAMVSGNGGAPTEMTGIFTPLLDINGPVDLSFNYTFNLPVHNRRWLKVYAADAANKPLFLLDSVELTGAAQGISGYHKSLSVPAAGSYKVYINYQGLGGNERIAIDQLSISAGPHYGPEGNMAPVALSDKFDGTPFRTATGNVLANDYDPNQEKMTAYLLTDSPDGIVELRPDGGFTFSPNNGFTGSTTHFSYKVCDNGAPALCSATMTATIHFPSAKAGLTSFQASYRKNGVDINWNTAAGNNSHHFEVERSLDGNNFEKVGEVKAIGDSAGEYAYTDKKGANIARKADLFYRLRQVDDANRVFYSKVMVVRTYGTKNVTAVSVTPDPEVNDILVNVQLKEKSFVVMKIMDSNGSQIIKKAALGAYGANFYSIEGTHDLQPGMYQLEVIINSNERMVMKLAKS